MNPLVRQWVLLCRALKSDICKPTDAVKLDIPTYFKVIKKPMDMSTTRKKLDAGEYPNATKFSEDCKLMIRNCFVFNPVGMPVISSLSVTPAPSPSAVQNITMTSPTMHTLLWRRGLNDELNCNACGLYCNLVGVFFWPWTCTDCFALSIVDVPLPTFSLVDCKCSSHLQHKCPCQKLMPASHSEG
jgi:hypothetical protein